MSKLEQLMSLIETTYSVHEPILTQFKVLKYLNDNSQTIITQYNQEKKKGIEHANNWIKNTTISTSTIKMVCHPEKWIQTPLIYQNYASSLVKTCQSNIDIVYDQIMSVPADKRSHYLKNFIIILKSHLVGSCLDNLCDALVSAMDAVNINLNYHYPIFDPTQTLTQNLSEFAVKFKDNTCIDCLKKIKKYDKSQMDTCLKNKIWINKPSVTLIHKHLKHLIGKSCLDDNKHHIIITEQHLVNFIEDYKDYLKDCDSSQHLILPSAPKIKIKQKPQPIQNIVPQPIQNIVPQPIIISNLDSQFVVGLNQQMLKDLKILADQCPVNKIKNPLTQICVKIDGKIGQKIVEEIKNKHKQNIVQQPIQNIVQQPVLNLDDLAIGQLPYTLPKTLIKKKPQPQINTILPPLPIKVPLKLKLKSPPKLQSVLINAIETFNFDLLFEHINTFNMNASYLFSNQKLNRPLFYLIEHLPQSYEILTTLIGLNLIDVNQVDANGETALHRLILTYDNFDLIRQLLLNVNITPNLKNKLQMTPLQLAIGMDNLEAIKILLQNAKVDINVDDTKQRSPLELILNKYKYNQQTNVSDVLFKLIQLFLSRTDLKLTSQIKTQLNADSKLKKYLDFYQYKTKYLIKKTSPLKFKPSELMTQWQKICALGQLKQITPEKLTQLRMFAKQAKISGFASLKPSALCVELAKSLVVYQKSLEKTHHLKCSNESNLLGDDFVDIPQDNIIQDDQGFCFSTDEIPEIIKTDKHPYTIQSWDSVKVKGIPFKTYVSQIKSSDLYQVHMLEPTNLQVISKDLTLILKLVDLINSPETKYLTTNNVEKYQSKSNSRSQLLWNLTKQEISIKYQNKLSLFKSPLLTTKFQNVTWVDMVQILITYIQEMPTTYSETAKYLVLHLLNQ